MNTNIFLLSFVATPLLGFLLTLFIPERHETALARTAFYTVGLQLLLGLVFVAYWLYLGSPMINVEELALYRTEGYAFVIDFFFDNITAVYLLTGAFITFLITRYSGYYLHIERGYKRFFNTILVFFLGYNVTILAGNFETLFIGWEMLGVSSFLLIAFYRERYLPVRNAVKVFSVYRIGDVGVLLAMWASHHLWHENVSFLKLNNYEQVHEHLMGHTGMGVFIAICLLTAAAAKSAQLPFSSWLPRAMEGPTPSSAIFYGSLSVHFGVFLMLRTFPFWEEQISVRILIGGMGLATALVAFFIARVQANIKTQIAYASIVQIGIMFTEVALGWENLALFHFAGNAFLRTYQLLVSPSVVSYLIRDQFYHFQGPRKVAEHWLPLRWQYSLYLLSLKEWYLDALVNRLVFRPFKQIGHRLDFLTPQNVLLIFVPVYLLGWFFYFQAELIPAGVIRFLPEVFAFTGLLMVFKSFSERQYPLLGWLLIVMNHFWVALAVSFNEHFTYDHTLLYLSGVVVAAVIGYVILRRIRREAPTWYSLNGYYGLAHDYPGLSLVFLLAALGLMGFPITYTFIGEDLIFSHIHHNQYLLAFFNALGYILGGISLIRIYARVFLGPHAKTTHGTPLRSS